MDQYQFVDSKNKVSVSDRLRDYNFILADVWDFLEMAGFAFHGVIRDWSAVFFQGTYFVLHTFLNDKPHEECIEKNSNLRWDAIFERDSSAGELFSFLERAGFQLMIPVQAMIDAMIDDGDNWHYQSPKHKFQMYCFHSSCAMLVEVYMQNQIPPYGAHEAAIPYPVDRCQPTFEFVFESLDNGGKKGRTRVVEGETLDILDKLDEELLAVTRERIKKVYDDHSRIGLLVSGGKDSRTVAQLMLEHAIANPDPTKKIMIISSDTLVENPGITKGIHDMKEALAKALPWVEFHIVEPREDETLMVCIIGKGYQAPSVTFKYCVRRLKIEPARDFLEAVFLTEGVDDTCLVMGSRDNESGNRRRSLEKYFGDEFYGHHPVGNTRTCSPIREWTSQEIVTYLAFNRAPWSKYGARNTELLQFYGSAAGSECPLGAAVVNDNEAMMQCGKSARTGCYACTISNDRSMGNLVSAYPEYEKYYRFRGILKGIGQDIRYGGTVGLQRVGRSKIGRGIGDLTIDSRTLILEAMHRLGIEWRESEILTAYQMVLHREEVEGFPLTDRFREAIYALLGVTGGFRGVLCNPIFDPFGTGVDQFTKADADAIARIMAEDKERETAVV
ncbi:phosphoadenosine phosphosulfate reductase family protein (plasmid) [Paenibacillus rhizovicinus]|uniref:Phosphoadenosine phosphosulfate reductase family protein n=1 Tax=Paenibacillus rhizovicinus TaxID=2704463 RepID=A0A6C0PCW2_9BACL|nr:phosphoadenosine phosphosulfate reductase family protein [Paenibacillus rhizovicinus]QHW35492.1 phosphoadenosine phosphosulfate reductase family protein [Paenibacillus rhizovicinus]